MGDYGGGLYGDGSFGDPGNTVPVAPGILSNVPQPYDRSSNSIVYVVDRFGNRSAELSTADVISVAFKLNDIGTADFTMPAEDPYNQKIILGSTEVQIIVDGVMWWGVVIDVKTDKSKSTYRCDDLTWYYSMRFVLTASLEYDSIEQFQIAIGISETAQTGTNRSFNIGTGSFAMSGKIRSRIYDRAQHPNMLDMLQEFPKVDNGFDFGVEYDATGLRTFNCYYPRKGVFLPDLHLELGRNIVDYNVNESAAQLATLVYATGGSSGAVKFEENYSDDAQAAVYGTRYEAITSFGAEQDVAWLQDKATKEVYDRESPTLVPKISVRDEPVQIWGVVKTGDSVWVKIEKGRVNVNNRYRILEMSRSPQDHTTDLTLVDDF